MSGAGIDLDAIVAIDVHTHVHISVDGAPDGGEQDDAFYEYFGADVVRPTVPDLAAYYGERHMACVCFMIDATTATGRPPAVSNDEIGRLAKEHRDVVIPFASIDPHTGAAGAAEVRRLVDEYGFSGFKFHPNEQAFFPNDP